MRNSSLEPISLAAESSTGLAYDNHVVANVNDHVVRVSVMTEEYHWHRHPDSDESFLVLEGSLLIDLDDRVVELRPGQLFTVNRGVRHRTRPAGARSVNLTFERRMQSANLCQRPGITALEDRNHLHRASPE